MIRISIYHWLPIADNLLPDIEFAFKHLGDDFKNVTAKIEGDSIYYQVSVELGMAKEVAGSYTIKGKINLRGFSQNVLDMPIIKGWGLNSTLNAYVIQVEKAISKLLDTVIPNAIRNKFAILTEGIVSYHEFFERERFEPLIDSGSIKFLDKYHTTSIMINGEFEPDIESATNHDLQLQIKDYSLIGVTDKYSLDTEYKQTFQLTEGKETALFLFYDKFFNFEASKSHIFDQDLSKFCELINYLAVLHRVIDILKKTRDHVFPLRRQLAITLQDRTEEHFSLLNKIKKYLSYINIKLPIVEKVQNHLVEAQSTEQFNGLRNILEPKVVSNNPFIKFKDVEKIQPQNIKENLENNTKRLKTLIQEAANEVKVISSELSQVLSGSLLSESVQISTRALETSRTILELARGGKNRDNALKILSIVVSLNTGALIGQFFQLILERFSTILPSISNLIQPFIPPIFAALAFFIAWTFIETSIVKKGANYKLIIPVNAQMPPDSIHQLSDNKTIKRAQHSSSHQIYTWNQTFLVPNERKDTADLLKGWFINFQPISDIVNKVPKKQKQVFEMSIEYEIHGYTHSILLETEARSAAFNSKSLIYQTLLLLDKTGCLINYHENSDRDQLETSLLVQVYSHLGINISDNFKALNKLLSTPARQLKIDWYSLQKEGEHSQLSENDQVLFQDMRTRNTDYFDWLVNAQKTEQQLRLLGKENLKKKIEFLREIGRKEENNL